MVVQFLVEPSKDVEKAVITAQQPTSWQHRIDRDAVARSIDSCLLVQEIVKVYCAETGLLEDATAASAAFRSLCFSSSLLSTRS